VSELEPGTAYFAPDPEAVHDQGDEPAEHPCPACVGGWHGEHCRGEFWTTGQPPALVECDCVEGACRGEWVEIGRLDTDVLPLADGGRVFIAPVGTAPPVATVLDAAGVEQRRRQAEYEAARQAEWEATPVLDRIGPPLPVHRVEDRENGRYVEVSIGPAHPAYAAVKAGLTSGLSVSPSTPETLSDNGPYVKLDPVPGVPSDPPSGVPVASPTVNSEQVRVSPGEVEQLAEVLAELARPKPLPRPNRATRRQLDKAAGRFGKRRRG